LIAQCDSPLAQQLVEKTVIHSSISQVDKISWNNLIQKENIYLGIPYLGALEMALPSYSFRYFQFYSEDNMLVGIGYCQIIKIGGNDINKDALVERMGGLLPKSLVNSIDMRILICGNAFASGENGFYFLPSIEAKMGLDLITSALDEVHTSAKKEGKKITITLIKEFWPESFENLAYLKDKGCCEINIDVNMVLTLDASWASFDDYLSAMNSKFRTKAKSIFKKSEKLTAINFDIPMIEKRLQEIDELYTIIVDKANFSFGRLNAKTLLEVKKALGNQFYFKGYYLGDKLIGFSTATSFNEILDGNFIGLDYDYNQEYAVYQRMLYDFVQHAIDIGAKQVKIGRTAEEIKSGVGAQPVEMKFYAKHRNKVTNALLRPFVQKLKPNNFNLRKPFKAEYYEV
jgi:hypothetical protein